MCTAHKTSNPCVSILSAGNTAGARPEGGDSQRRGRAARVSRETRRESLSTFDIIMIIEIRRPCVRVGLTLYIRHFSPPHLVGLGHLRCTHHKLCAGTSRCFSSCSWQEVREQSFRGGDCLLSLQRGRHKSRGDHVTWNKQNCLPLVSWRHASNAAPVLFTGDSTRVTLSTFRIHDLRPPMSGLMGGS